MQFGFYAARWHSARVADPAIGVRAAHYCRGKTRGATRERRDGSSRNHTQLDLRPGHGVLGSPLCVAIIAGLLVSTLISLIVVPALYLLLTPQANSGASADSEEVVA